MYASILLDVMATRDTSSISNNMTETKTNNEEIIKNIKWVLEEKVKPSVAQHNGVINFISFDDGVVKLEMAGSCSGCAMSKMTLQQGVENLLKHYVPEVQAIVSEDDDKAKEQGYTPYFPSAYDM